MTDNKSRNGRISHKGISLIEVVVIVAIIAVLGGIMGYNIAVTNGFRARKCKNLMASQIAELKVRTLSKAAKTGDVYLKIYKDGKTVYSKVYYKELGSWKQDEPVELGSRISVDFGGSSHTRESIGDESTTQLVLCYNRATGALVDKDSPTTLSDIEYIISYATSNKEYKIELVPATGKVVNVTR